MRRNLTLLSPTIEAQAGVREMCQPARDLGERAQAENLIVSSASALEQQTTRRILLLQQHFARIPGKQLTPRQNYLHKT